MENTAQFLLYNQLDERYILSSNVFYIHHVGEINNGYYKINFNKYSKIIDYAGGKYLIQKIKKKGYNGRFFLAKSYTSGIREYCKQLGINTIIIVKPTEYYFYKNLLKTKEKLEKEGINIIFKEDKQSFLLSEKEFKWKFKKAPLLENFYRYMRKKYNILMNGENPEGGQRNFDKMNRKFDKNHSVTKQCKLKMNKYFEQACDYYSFYPEHILPTNREEAIESLDFFVENNLDNFGAFQDAMYTYDPFVFHSLLSSSINFGFISPMEVIKKIENSNTEIQNKEGFIRQILGWREYMFHFFNLYKQDLYKMNFFGHKKGLPDFFWDGRKLSGVKLNCIKSSISNVHTYNYGHHIERLMIIGNYSLLTKTDPQELNKWFWESYVDAFEWVVTPNVLAMSQYADGGKMATKPYISSANYISKMSNFCDSCYYDKKEKYGEKACPFNYLYWNFINDNIEVFKSARQSFVIKNLEKIDIEKIKKNAQNYL
ncbi:cryptochrome/photolyase family protein [Candidatus Absconditicoccus praedator]|uniref:cryptochrome/photolyase family protein n=1 Tax=Candidatus Absconditicoccus praedator TaxID=2735562 RepID=UPI001E42F2B6|nr:cryptochrome/photolyase family protein [Candidatus Absconditicoccus praedator]UFX82925.1 cryptochrome/photolyase family protein [Candidatus Absconditicoccus praedator]